MNRNDLTSCDSLEIAMTILQANPNKIKQTSKYEAHLLKDVQALILFRKSIIESELVTYERALKKIAECKE